MIDTIKNLHVSKAEVITVGTTLAISVGSIALAVYQTKVWVALQSVGVAAGLTGYAYFKYEQAKK